MVEYAILACHYSTFQNNNIKHYFGNGPDVVIKAYCHRAINDIARSIVVLYEDFV